MSDKLLESQAAVFKALAGGERCVCELRTLVGADMSTVSKHLTVLKNAGVVEADRRGNNIYYRLVLTCLSGVFTCLDADSRCPGVQRPGKCSCS